MKNLEKHKNKILRRYLEKQFVQRHVASYDRARIEIVDVAAARVKTKVPAVIVSGWASTANVLKENILALAVSGRRVVYANAPHGIPTSDHFGYPAAEMRKVAALLLTLEARGIARADVIAHSEGAIVTAIAAMLRPEKFRNIVLVNPAGLTKKKAVKELAATFSADVLWGELRQLLVEPSLAKTVLTTWLEAGKTIIADPYKAWAEVEAISAAEISGLLRNLNQRGIGVAVIHTKDDKTFPVGEVCAGARTGKACKIITLPGRHYELYLKPVEFARMCDKVLTSLERRLKN